MWANREGRYRRLAAPASAADGTSDQFFLRSARSSCRPDHPVEGSRRVCGWWAYLAAPIRVGTQPCGLQVPRRRSASCVGEPKGPHRHLADQELRYGGWGTVPYPTPAAHPTRSPIWAGRPDQLAEETGCSGVSGRYMTTEYFGYTVTPQELTVLTRSALLSQAPRQRGLFLAFCASADSKNGHARYTASYYWSILRIHQYITNHISLLLRFILDILRERQVLKPAPAGLISR